MPITKFKYFKLLLLTYFKPFMVVRNLNKLKSHEWTFHKKNRTAVC